MIEEENQVDDFLEIEEIQEDTEEEIKDHQEEIQEESLEDTVGKDKTRFFSKNNYT